MRNLILVILFASSTLVQAQGAYNTQDRGYEMNYDDLVQELSTKKKLATDTPAHTMGFERIQVVFGYSFSTMDLNLPSGGNAFNFTGIDIRANGQFVQSHWQLEGGIKNYARISNGNKSAESRILTTSLKNQDYLNSNLQYVVGFSSSLHFINAQDLNREKNELSASLNVTAGLRGPLSNQLSWGVDLNAYSPVSGKLLKGGLDATLLLSSVL